MPPFNILDQRITTSERDQRRLRYFLGQVSHHAATKKPRRACYRDSRMCGAHKMSMLGDD
jgi:hypothetical protein